MPSFKLELSTLFNSTTLVSVFDLAFIKTKKCQFSTFRQSKLSNGTENLSLRYPHLSKSIMFNEIDNILMFNVCRRMSNIWCGFIGEQRSTWIQTLQKHVKIFENSSEPLKKSFNNLLTVQQIIKNHSTHYEPLHYTVMRGNRILDLCIHSW